MPMRSSSTFAQHGSVEKRDADFDPARRKPGAVCQVWMRTPALSTWLVDRRAGFCGFCVRLRVLRSAVLALRDVDDRGGEIAYRCTANAEHTGALRARRRIRRSKPGAVR